MRRKYCLSLLLILAIFVAAGCGASGSDQKSKVIGSVNGDEITQAELDNSYKIISMYYDQQMAQMTSNQSSNSGIKISSVKPPQVVEQLKEKAWEDVVNKKLILQAAPQEGIEMPDKELDQITNSDQYKKFVKANKLEGEAYRESLKAQYLYNGLQEKISKQAEVSDQEITDYYNAHRSEYQEAGGVETYHILVDDEKLANEILAKLKNGEDFATLAQKYSTCPSKKQGGYLGLGNKDMNWDETFKAAALALKPGEMTRKPVHSQFGYHIIKAGSEKPGSIRSLQDSRNQISMTLQKQKEAEAFNKYLEALEKKAVIKDLRPKSTTQTDSAKPNTSK